MPSNFILSKRKKLDEACYKFYMNQKLQATVKSPIEERKVIDDNAAREAIDALTGEHLKWLRECGDYHTTEDQVRKYMRQIAEQTDKEKRGIKGI